jgi:hypothetical protein
MAAMSPRLRKFTLAAHVISSVGWLGAAATYVVLAVFVLTNHNPQLVRAAILAMETVVLFVIAPLAALSLVTGVVQSLGSVWGLFWHYWVLFKFLLTSFAVFLLAEYTQSMVGMAGVAAHPTLSRADLHRLQDIGHGVHSAGGLSLLLVVTVLAVYKPRGMTRYGQRKQRAQRRTRRGQPAVHAPLP